MEKEYLLDTNAFFNILKLKYSDSSVEKELLETINELCRGKLYISEITKVEIISVLGKYARGNNGGTQPCDCTISPEGKKCENIRYLPKRKKWNSKKTKAWLKLIRDTITGNSDIIKVELLPFNAHTVVEAERIILHALVYNFASMDSMIAATAKEAIDHSRDMTVITSDKSLKNCLCQCSIPCWDIFS